jgi:hypothetical protein
MPKILAPRISAEDLARGRLLILRSALSLSASALSWPSSLSCYH